MSTTETTYTPGTFLKGRNEPEEQLSVIEDRGCMVLVERCGLVRIGQHRRPFLLD